MARSESRRASLVLFGPALSWVALSVVGLWMTATDESAWSAVERRESTPVGSDRCASCHPAEHATWHHSYHRTMTQRAEGDAVLAPFEGERLEALGFSATMTGGHARPHVRIERVDPEPGVDPVMLDVDIELTVGSHRYQQYVARIDRGGGPQERWRLPVAWHVELSRWIHINEAFLTPEGAWGEREDYLRHLSRWNDNCIFCHNTEPVPGRDDEGRFDTEVAELGIACEACHGAASAHVQRHAWPLRRVLAGIVADEGDGSIAHPGRMSTARHADVCGRCHGNRIAQDLDQVMRQGDGFTPGHPLSEVSRPILRDSTLAGQPGEPFTARFWPDGTPRLSAYEYQALQLSACHLDGEGLGCGDCHTMHGPEPSMQLWPGHDGAAVCQRCHEPGSLSDASASGGHGRHGEAVGCEGCHAPRITYGLLEGMMSHRITVPRPGRWLDRDDQPDACTQCHVDHSRQWAADALDAWARGDAPSSADAEPSRVALDLLGGDPIQRALAAHALSWPEAPVDARARMAWLVDVLEDDYPAVRWFGFRGLRAMAEAEGMTELRAWISDPAVMDDPGSRTQLQLDLRGRLGPGALADDAELRKELGQRRDDVAIWIGE